MATATQQTNNASTLPASSEKKKTLAHYLSETSFKQSIAAALPQHMRADRMLRVMLTELRKNPRLKSCSPESFMSAILQSSQLGLEPGLLGQSYLIPYKSECTLIIGYRGMLELARRSGQVLSIQAHVVDEADVFAYKFGLNPILDHTPAQSKTGRINYVYACATLKNGAFQFEVLTRQEIETLIGKDKLGSQIWRTHFEEMAKKTAIRRLFKYLPVSQELNTAIILDEQASALGKQDPYLIDCEENDETSYQTRSDQISSIMEDDDIVCEEGYV